MAAIRKSGSIRMIRKRMFFPVVITLLIAAFLFTGCSSGGKYYASKSKKYKKLKRKYEKYDCGCYAAPGTLGDDPIKSCAYPDF